MAKRSKQYGRSQGVVHPARTYCFEVEAILTSFGFDRFRPWLRWQSLRYRHIAAPRRLALNEIASNLESVFHGS